MPQVFQVLKCYKCSIFQVHQTKKSNKWKCKVCGEKQSVKRHYGIGTAKDCRIHVQKLNNMQGNMEEPKLTTTDSDSAGDSDDSNTDNTIDEIKTENVKNITQLSTNNAKKESKWSNFVEEEEIFTAKEPEFIDNVEVCLELPRKRRINRKRDTFKVPKLPSNNDCNKKAEIIKDIINLSNSCYEELNSVNNRNFTELQTDNNESSMKEQFESNRKKNEVMNFQVSKTSKWAQYENNETNDHNTILEKDFDSSEDNIQYYEDTEDEAQNIVYNSQNNEYNDDEKLEKDGCMNSQKTEKDLSSITPIFSLCDDNELDDILDF
ncbi:uncharacterized protein LOC112047312 [Bicyclus anynana]|uniref:Uncharacterized protein LOC112047312 n=1 Tax=Bicyclus anynana TaxID=110368 RepID=A0A6J1MX63_BICAN|nr:uncharacterized protein LOC112047312 [Bicyclus anynana]